VEISGGFVETGFFGDGGCIDNEDDGAQVLGVGELGRRIVAELAVAGRVQQKEAAGALKGRVAGGAVV
jgi:hypothetical protein